MNDEKIDDCYTKQKRRKNINKMFKSFRIANRKF